MKSSIKELPIAIEISQAVSRQVEWGGMAVGVVEVRQTLDAAPLFRGLPDDRCQLPHWGYVIKGRFHCKFADHEEVYKAGDVYFIPPGHTPVLEEGLVYVEFSPAEEVGKQSEVIGRNLQALLE